MLEAVVLIILILIVIFIVYLSIFSQGTKYNLVGKDNIKFYKKKENKMMSYYTDNLKIKNDSTYMIYYELPVNSIYWTIGFYDKSGCITSINMGKYQTTEKGDTLAIIASNNKNAIASCKNEVSKEHNRKFRYKKLTFEEVKIEGEFFIRFDSYSNMFLESPLMTIKEYHFNNIIMKEFKNESLEESTIRSCEKQSLFELCREDFIDERCIPIEINCDTKEECIPIECYTNRSDTFDVSETIYKKTQYGMDIYDEPIAQFKILAVDHFKSRAALHSHLVFYNAEDDTQFDIEITGEFADRLNQFDTITTRKISFIVPEEIKKMYVVEYIYFDFVSGNKVKMDTVIPMEVYKVI